MKVWVLVVSNSEDYYVPAVFDSKVKAVTKMVKCYSKEIEEYDEEGYSPIEVKEINIEEGWAYIQFRDNHIDYNIYEKEVE
jgi:hypothetical protein